MSGFAPPPSSADWGHTPDGWVCVHCLNRFHDHDVQYHKCLLKKEPQPMTSEVNPCPYCLHSTTSTEGTKHTCQDRDANNRRSIVEAFPNLPNYCPTCTVPFSGNPAHCPGHGLQLKLWTTERARLGVTDRDVVEAKQRLQRATEPDRAIKADGGKNPLELLPFLALEQVGLVLDFGAKKYAAHNWRKGLAWSRLGGAAIRHMFSWMTGQNKDPETGLSHLAHAACCILFLLEYEQVGGGTDDRVVLPQRVTYEEAQERVASYLKGKANG